MTLTAVYSKCFQNTSKKQSDWLTFGNMVISYGGWRWKPAVAGAKLHCMKAAAMGPIWCYQDGMSGLWMFKKITEREVEDFKEAWETFKSYGNNQTVEGHRAAQAITAGPMGRTAATAAMAGAPQGQEPPESSDGAAQAEQSGGAPKAKSKGQIQGQGRRQGPTASGRAQS